MSNKIKYHPDRESDAIEFNTEVVYIELPNGDQYSFRYNHRDPGLTINKVEGANGNSTMSITPHVSNQITIK